MVSRHSRTISESDSGTDFGDFAAHSASLRTIDVKRGAVAIIRACRSMRTGESAYSAPGTRQPPQSDFAGYDDGMRARIGMRRGLGIGLPFVARPRDTPLFALVGNGRRLRFGLQLVRAEFATETHVIVDADRRLEALGPMRDHPLDLSPGPDGTNIDPLVLVELCVRHGSTIAARS